MHHIMKNRIVKNPMEDVSDENLNSVNLTTSLTFIFMAAYSIYIGYHPPISNFCTNNTTFTKINNVTIANPEIPDVHKMLGESGKVIQMYRAEGITEFSFIAAIILLSICQSHHVASFFTIGLCLSALVFAIIFIDMYFQNAIPSQCIDSLMGNNFAYYTMEIKVVLNLVVLSLAAFGVCLACTGVCGAVTLFGHEDGEGKDKLVNESNA